MRVLPVGDAAMLVEARDLDETLRLLQALMAAALPGVLDLVPAARTILVRFDPAVTTAGAVRERVREVQPVRRLSARGDQVTIPVRYDGDDLDEVASLLGLTVDALIARHQAAAWTVAFTGFAPGFGYLVGDDPIFDVPRRSMPRTRVPAGSVGLAGRFSGVYPNASPGGWQLIGRTDLELWNPERDPPALLRPGTAVCFERVDRALIARARPRQRHASDEHAVAVLRAGAQLLVQDLGRPGLGSQGVSASGTADRGALREANRAVGNRPDDACLELTGGGARLQFRGDAVVALTGASAAALVASRGQLHAVDAGRAFAIDDGDALDIGAVRDGLRVLIGIRGGIAIEPVLGSLSSDTLAQLGPAPLRAGDVVPLHGPRHGVAAVEHTRAPRVPLPAAGDTVELEILPGPREGWFSPASIAKLTQQEWLVTSRADRVGLQLAGEAPLERADRGELESEGTVTGAIQVPPEGQPVLFLPDHPLTGGYPVIAVVIDRHLDIAGQLPPGVRIRFRPASHAGTDSR